MSYSPSDLEEARQRWADRPETPPKAWAYRAPPIWPEPTHLRRASRHLDALYRVGEVWWAHIFLTHRQVWSGEGWRTRGAWVAWSHDPVMQREPECLGALCAPLTALHEHEAPLVRELVWQRGLGRFAHVGWRQRIPDSVTGGAVGWVGRVPVDTRRLPGEAVHNRVLPLLVQISGEDTLAAVPLPAAYWPERTRVLWARRAAKLLGVD